MYSQQCDQILIKRSQHQLEWTWAGTIGDAACATEIRNMIADVLGMFDDIYQLQWVFKDREGKETQRLLVNQYGFITAIPNQLAWLHVSGIDVEKWTSFFIRTVERASMKYGRIAWVGHRIRSYDFEGNKVRYVEGVVEEITDKHGFWAYRITCDIDHFAKQLVGTNNTGRVGMIVFVPMEISFSEWDGRVVRVEENDEH